MIVPVLPLPVAPLPMFIVAVAVVLPKLMVVGPFKRLKVDAELVRSPPFTARSPVRVVLPATAKAPANVAF